MQYVVLSSFKLHQFTINKMRFGSVCTSLYYILKVIRFIKINIAGRSMQFCTYLLNKVAPLLSLKVSRNIGWSSLL